jgi:hypothetical protein
MPLRSLRLPLLRSPSAGLTAAVLLVASALTACSAPDKPAASRAPSPAAPSAPPTPANGFESGVRTMTGAIPRARDAAADMNQRSAENAAAANAVQ